MLINFRQELNMKKGELRQLESQLFDSNKNLRSYKRKLEQTEKARIIIQNVAKQTQQELEYHVSDIVTMALRAVFPEPYDFKMEFVIKRNKTECELYFVKDGELIDPLTASGGGAVDVASFALRVALWCLAPQRTRNTLILDEPFRFLSRDLMYKAGDMLKRLSEKLGLQIIMVSHAEDLIDGANKVFQIKIKKGISEVN